MSALFIPEVRRKLVMRGIHLVLRACIGYTNCFIRYKVCRSLNLTSLLKIWVCIMNQSEMTTQLGLKLWLSFILFIFFFFFTSEHIYSTHSYPNGFIVKTNACRCLASCCEDKKNHNTQRCQSFPLGCVINVVFMRQILNGESPGSAVKQVTSLRYD